MKIEAFAKRLLEVIGALLLASPLLFFSFALTAISFEHGPPDHDARGTLYFVWLIAVVATTGIWTAIHSIVRRRERRKQGELHPDYDPR